MRITKSIAGFTEINTRTQEFFELKVVALAHEEKKIQKCKKECERIIRGIDNEPDNDKQEERSID